MDLVVISDSQTRILSVRNQADARKVNSFDEEIFLGSNASLFKYLKFIEIAIATSITSGEARVIIKPSELVDLPMALDLQVVRAFRRVEINHVDVLLLNRACEVLPAI